ncbi:acyltransferase domain-containing protein [Streptomyces sp. H27-D2]|uniref:acyltransferase domain-containing protein n=1 Tax=Streptomyces sp. H27-D2 TaxID=3046304 RepID=UPI002DBDE976|nr:acyltransferase domain-containing protein [Streptomyces sp. H27-D2]MEC4017647.1 acyltransferase domain-containing protein [Streptomyces sp. H27-D2]
MSVPPRESRELAYADWLTERLTRYLGRPVDETVPFAEQGLDSVAALSLYGDIEEEFGPLIDPTDIWEYPTVRSLAWQFALRDPRPGDAGQVRAAFVFTGQGSQHPGMTSGLYLHSTDYRTFLDEAADALQPYTGLSVVDLILSGDLRIHQTAFTQPALFAVEYALARTLEASGVRPVAVLGHGIGEFAAAAIAGALTLADAAKLVALRGAFMQYLPSNGGMLATCAPSYEAAELAAGEPGVSISAINAAKATVLSGDLAGLERIQDRLALRGIASTPLKVTHPFHSPLMEPVVPKFEVVARRLPGGAPRLPFYSTVHGRFTNEPLYAPYWTRQITAPVRFADAARQLLAQQTPSHIVEIGPRVVLTPFLRRLGGRSGPICLAMCRGPESNAVDLAGVLSALDAGPLNTALART